jgi:hypothetical protein
MGTHVAIRVRAAVIGATQTTAFYAAFLPTRGPDISLPSTPPALPDRTADTMMIGAGVTGFVLKSGRAPESPRPNRVTQLLPFYL